ncbi:MAG: hypothetical protein K9N05_03040 [Candidatus Marinimicrobia bacterium]|nr:hypothetical protein [Candidatus Neomarinimicrobiota bacterium]
MFDESLFISKKFETFDKTVFMPDNNFNKEICGFVLALSVIWNDIKNLDLFIENLNNFQLSLKEKYDVYSSIRGEISGITYSFLMKSVSTINELFYLIRKSNKVLKNENYKKIIKQMRNQNRTHWLEIVDIARMNANDHKNNDTAPSEFKNILILIRNNVGFHYSSKELLGGYILEYNESNKIPYISRGNSMKESRFYYADASVQAYYESKIKSDLYSQLNLIRKEVNNSIMNLVTQFINLRAPFRECNKKEC